jgi:hypothetical protein
MPKPSIFACSGHTNLIVWIAGEQAIKNSWHQVFLNNRKKQHDFPEVTFTLDGIWRHGGIILQLEVIKMVWKWKAIKKKF